MGYLNLRPSIDLTAGSNLLLVVCRYSGVAECDSTQIFPGPHPCGAAPPIRQNAPTPLLWFDQASVSAPNSCPDKQSLHLHSMFQRNTHQLLLLLPQPEPQPVQPVRHPQRRKVAEQVKRLPHPAVLVVPGRVG